ncbi:MAG TPA: glycoside hydrolase family 2 TIM barrel-domain containing protein [Phycisphaerae bacterium]|nr:glycoside hydrolase family 2 TIM barrel-domain containing protein [Phycisphaerae bacterium]
MKTLSLNGTDWTVTGYWQNQWRFERAGDLGQSKRVPVPAVPAVVPGAVHADLLRAGIIPNWQDGLNAEKTEWVNNREWMYAKTVTVPAEWAAEESGGERTEFERDGGGKPRRSLERSHGRSRGAIVLECDGLDYSGLVFVDGREVGTFEGTHLRHRFDLTGFVEPGQTFKLEILFHLSPQIEGVFGFTSRTRIFKPRFGYCWDWCPRVVNVGIWQDVRLVQRGPAEFEHARVQARVDDDLQRGHVRVVANVVGEPASVRYVVTDRDGVSVASGERPCEAGPLDLKILVEAPGLWWPQTLRRDAAGDDGGSAGTDRRRAANLYRVRVELLDAAGQISDVIERPVGFRRVRWLDNPGAPAGAKPYLCEVNGVPLFIRGINWVPLSPFYGTVSRERYEAVLRLYANMNVNLIRVWGGAILETETFYELCDELGLMVWQEFPLSSSGVENWPPEDPDVIEHLQTIATEYIERRGHHASHVLWCGGNELQGGLDGSKTGVGKPVDELHPLMLRWQELLARIDPGKRFQATSPSGPMFYAHAENMGKGIHHQTHGPWGWGDVSFDNVHAYWNRDDSLFRSENGVPGCSSMAALERHKGDASLWPPSESNRHWVVPAAAWIPWGDVTAAIGEIPDDPAWLPLVVKIHRYMQAESYRYAAEACRRRFPNCSGYIIWMGHDNVHNTSNNSVVQIDGSTKPAYDFLQRAYAPRHVSLRYESLAWRAGERFAGRVFVHADATVGPQSVQATACGSSGTVRAVLRLLDGQVIETAAREVKVGMPGGQAVLDLDWPVPTALHELFVVELNWDHAGSVVRNQYLFTQNPVHLLAPLAQLEPVELFVQRESRDRIRVENRGKLAAIGVRLVSSVPDCAILTRGNNMILMPGESYEFRYAALALEPGLPVPETVCVEWLNSTGAGQVV